MVPAARLEKYSTSVVAVVAGDDEDDAVVATSPNNSIRNGMDGPLAIDKSSVTTAVTCGVVDDDIDDAEDDVDEDDVDDDDEITAVASPDVVDGVVVAVVSIAGEGAAISSSTIVATAAVGIKKPVTIQADAVPMNALLRTLRRVMIGPISSLSEYDILLILCLFVGTTDNFNCCCRCCRSLCCRQLR